MEILAVAAQRIFQAYQRQEKLAELNRTESVRVVQNHADQVSISPQARQLLEQAMAQQAAAQAPAPAHGQESAPASAPEAPAAESPEATARPAGYSVEADPLAGLGDIGISG